MKRWLLAFAVAFAAALIYIGISATRHERLGRPRVSQEPQVRSRAELARAGGNLDVLREIRFEENIGQTVDEVKFLSRGTGYTLFLTPDAAVLKAASKRGAALVRLQLAGANPNAKMQAVDQLPGSSNYYVGNDPAKWRSDVRQFARVRYHDIYPGIDLVFYGRDHELEYDLIVAPGADPSCVHIQIEGAEHLAINDRGDATIQTTGGPLSLRQPTIYQEVNGRRRPIQGALVQVDECEIGFRVAEYDRSVPLVIDPVFTAGFGGTGNDEAFGIAGDLHGNIYVTGLTLSTDFPVNADAAQKALGGKSNVFVVSINQDATAINYATYLGGNGNDGGLGIAADRFGIAYVTGYASSTNFPVAGPLARPYAGGKSDGFVAAINLDGSLAAAMLLGGSGDDQGNGIAVDLTGNVYVSGITNSTNFLTMNPFQAANGGGFDYFVTKLSPGLTSVKFSSYLGGSKNEGSSFAPTAGPTGGVAVDAKGNAYLTGLTLSVDFPTTAASAFQPTVPGGGSFSSGHAFLAKIKANGTGLAYSTYFGGTGTFDHDSAFAVGVDPYGWAAITGTTFSTTLPLRNAQQSTYAGNSGRSNFGDGFVALFDTTKVGDASLSYASYLGSNGDDAGFGVTLDPFGNITVAGTTTSPKFPFATAPSGGSIFRSIDGGMTWTRANHGLINSDPQFGSTFVNDVVVDPSDATGNTVYVSTVYGGVFKCTNFLTHDPAGPNWTEMNNGITDHFGMALAIDPTNSQRLGYGTEFGTLFITTNGGGQWTKMDTGLGFSVSSINSILFTPGGNMFCGTGLGGVRKSTDGGATWTPSSTGISGQDVLQVVSDPKSPNNTLYAVSGGIYKSTDGGAHWAPANANLRTDFYPGALFTPTLLKFIPGNPAKEIVAVQGDFNGINGGLFQSTNGGASFTKLAEFPLFGLNDVAVDPDDPNDFYFGTGVGVYKSSDGGKTWSASGLDGTGITGLQQMSLTNYSGLIATGSGGSDGFVTKIPKNGTPKTKIYGGTGGIDELRAAYYNYYYYYYYYLNDPIAYAWAYYYYYAYYAGTTSSRDMQYVNTKVEPPTLPTGEVFTGTIGVPQTQNGMVIADNAPTGTPAAARPEADITVDKVCQEDAKNPGTVVCTVTLKNLGPDKAANVDVTDTCKLNATNPQTGLPADVTATPLAGSAGKSIRFDLPDLAKDESRQITITYKNVKKNFSNTAVGYSSAHDANANNNVKRVDATVGGGGPKVNNVAPPKSKPAGDVKIDGTGLNGGSKAERIASTGAAAVTTTTVVKFNGLTAKILAISDTQITAEVPAGATSGPLTVTTSQGTATAPQDFVVLPAIQQLLNISTRLRVLTDENVLIGGFIVTGNDDKKVLLRGLGPSLTAKGVPNALGDPILALHKGKVVVATNDDWKQTQQTEIQATTIPPTSDLESAMVRTLTAHGTAYTAIVSGKAGGTGIGQVEAYDLNQASADSQLANISTRGFVDTDDNVLIGGVIIGGGATGSTTHVLVRAIGPSLTSQGVANALQDPMLELRDVNGHLIAQNDDWRSDQEQAIKATTAPPSDNREAALVHELGAGNYTAIVRGKNNTTGVGLVELYNLP